ncbi:MAG: MerR family transcriptional regulator [Bacteroidales bacterium]|jgi:DNA-binding transcriptional MerR regulator|nr:transcriptional regulator [Lentimicrobiaceae bacterium]MDG1136286.1 MerR family transcriptional regulator [Bacteroidales bacterium]MDG1901463.1 MerR family transcriptional regulator [Bacteroidales bacterium]MDG2080905.1 MerR family transcriptional regulator [Bacteroidales bacterium]|tara:strand:+ start:13240 stop:13572 length:333 start_codon:yes stop_codon:yes gene_type:complete
MSEKLYLKIGDVAKKFNVNTSLLRYWEQEFDFIKPKKNAKGTRYYSQKEINNISIVHYLVKEKGMTIQGVKDYLDNRKSGKSLEQLDVISTLKKTKELLIGLRDILQKRK